MQLKRFILKALIFLVINTLILAGLLLYFSGRNRQVRMDNGETESNLLAMGTGEHYGLVLMGTSRGRVLSRDGNHRTNTYRLTSRR